MKIGYLGPKGTFSYEACKEYCQNEEEMIEYKTIPDTIMALENEEIDECIVPIENSLQGCVTDAIDTLIQNEDIYVEKEILKSINQNIMSNKKCELNEIEVLYSHPQALAQCKNYINNNLKNAKIVAVDSTAYAAKKVSEEKEKIVSCIGNISCRDEYKLNLISEKIQDNIDNQTKFWILSKEKKYQKDTSKMSMIFSVKDKPGALYRVLEIFNKYNLNLTKIESRPAKTIMGEYYFLIDVSIEESRNEEQAISEIMNNGIFYKNTWEVLKKYIGEEEKMISDKMKELIKNNSVVREMFEEGKRLKKLYGDENVYDFSLGNPSVEAPKEIKENIIKVLNNEDSCVLHGYMSNSGFEDVRESIANSINERFGTSFDYTNIIMTVGAASGLNIVFKSILNKDDEVIVIAPYFSEYNNYIKNYDGKVSVINSKAPEFYPDLKELELKINEKTKAVLINTPNNPTGAIYPESVITDIAAILDKKQKEYKKEIYLISDEPYRELAYDENEVPYITNYYDNTIVVYSYSKSLSLPGERIGYVLVSNKLENNEELIEALTIANRIIGCVNAPSLMQKVIKESLDLKVDIDRYNKNRNLLYNILIENGFECTKPEGAFYMFVKTPIKDDKEFCKIAKKYNLLFVPGSSFACPGYVRIAYCVSYGMIEKSRQAFENLSKEFKLK